MAWAVALAALAACASRPTGTQPSGPPPDAEVRPTPRAEVAPALQDEPLGATPRDFELDVTVLIGRSVPESLRVEDRTARYVLLPDGALHAETGPLLTQASRPGRARWLYQQQVSELWEVCNQTEFTNLSLANGPANPDMLTVERDERLLILNFKANGVRWCFVRRTPADQPVDPGAARLVRTLAALAWIPDYTARDLAPERYDYGPDPYAVYRAIRDAGKRP
ncbi:MAG: hypothetical protein JNK53_07665 [Phycisphaerae bacterium]|nr:hypothetical protein [Phycisphaerae bacterium]